MKKNYERAMIELENLRHYMDETTNVDPSVADQYIRRSLDKIDMGLYYLTKLRTEAIDTIEQIADKKERLFNDIYGQGNGPAGEDESARR